MVTFEKDDSGRTDRLILEGDLDIEQAAGLGALLKRALDEVEDVAVTMERLAAISLPCIQVLFSAHVTASQRGKRLRLEGALAPPFSRALEELGCTHYLRRELDRGSFLEIGGTERWAN